MRTRDIFCHGIKRAGLTVLPLLMFFGCSQAEFSKSPDPTGTGTAVCNPFGGTPPTSQNGLSGSIYYLSDSQPLYSSVNEYFQNGHREDATLFLSELFVPTRLFSDGFAQQNGRTLTREDNSVLVEKFALQLTSNIRLAADDTEGWRQFAVLSDDGTIFSVNENGIDKVLVNNDSIHPSEFGCGLAENVYFNHATKLPMKISYFQGPRYQISLILMWRIAPNQSPQMDPYCGAASNEMWFDYNHGSAPQQAFYNLIANGWQPLRSVNYWLDTTNPCAQ